MEVRGNGSWKKIYKKYKNADPSGKYLGRAKEEGSQEGGAFKRI